MGILLEMTFWPGLHLLFVIRVLSDVTSVVILGNVIASSPILYGAYTSVTMQPMLSCHPCDEIELVTCIRRVEIKPRRRRNAFVQDSVLGNQVDHPRMMQLLPPRRESAQQFLFQNSGNTMLSVLTRLKWRTHTQFFSFALLTGCI